ncbi:hypothetical protein GPA22_01430 [Aromatoleum toluvorans]|uniref:Alpha/beta hydrolase n=1 Tax=Aromatoleum toluvorans TaxID=92002 RepID=A0ABX1PVV0_9RHOO|nr:hypothetical protein [Aromatoleum toluvorans]NMG42395.1 hypothetical protein [Aromatoleum toluvorans]
MPICSPQILPPADPPAIVAWTACRTAAGARAPSAPATADEVTVGDTNRAGAATDLPPLPGCVEQRALRSDSSLRYVVYVPSRGGVDAPILVSVHGISRNALEHVKLFAPFAERAGVVVVAPLYERERFPDYQRLSANARGESPVAVMEAIVAEVARTTGALAAPLRLFGYSGGGQFVHRYAMAHPERVAAYVVGAAGWYTFPDAERRYPYGLRYSRRLQMGGFDLNRFLAVPGWVLVGERDVHEGTAMRKTDRVTLDQGESRLERGRRWVEAINAAAAARGQAGPVRFETLARSPHNFRRSMRRGNLGERVFSHLFGSARAGVAW